MTRKPSPPLPEPFIHSHAGKIPAQALLLKQMKSLFIKGAKITEAAINYIGSISLPTKWFKDGIILNGQVVRVSNTTTFENDPGAPPEEKWMTTYAIRDPNDNYSGIRSNGGAAQRIKPGDSVSLHSFVCFKKKGQLVPAYYNCKEGYTLEPANSHIEGALNIKDSYIPMYAGKLHRIIATNKIPETLETQSKELDAGNELVMLVDRKLAKLSGFKEGDHVDFLMVYKNVRETVRVVFTDEKGHMSLHGKKTIGEKTITAKELTTQPVNPTLSENDLKDLDKNKANPNTVVVIGYKMMKYPEAVKYSNWITNNGFPNLVIFDSVINR